MGDARADRGDSMDDDDEPDDDEADDSDGLPPGPRRMAEGEIMVAGGMFSSVIDRSRRVVSTVSCDARAAVSSSSLFTITFACPRAEW
jgi:hypothetical protein